MRRFEQGWERAASLRLRSGDAGVLAEYDQRGRILEGTREEMTGAAWRRWLADHLSGRESLLLATTNAQATDLARRARDELAALGLVATRRTFGSATSRGDALKHWMGARSRLHQRICRTLTHSARPAATSAGTQHRHVNAMIKLHEPDNCPNPGSLVTVIP